MSKHWKIGIVHDTAQKCKGDHGTHFAFTGLPDTEITLADPNGNGIGARLAAIGATRHYFHYRDLIAKEHPDIVVVCSRLPGDHFPVIEAAAERGCHVLCEKPLAASLQDADAIIALAAKHHVKIAVAHLARYALVFRTVKKMIEQGEIGVPLTFYGRGKEDERGGGEDMMVLGTHILDLAVFLFGRPEYVFADVRTAGRPLAPTDRCSPSEPVGICAGDAVWANFRFANGVNGLFESRKGLCTGPVRMGITVTGTAGTISVRYDQERALRISRSKLPLEDEASYEKIMLHEDRTLPSGAEPLNYEIYSPQPAQYFANCNRWAALDLMQAIMENRLPAASIEHVVTSLEMMYGVYSSSLERRAISFPMHNRNHPLGE